MSQSQLGGSDPLAQVKEWSAKLAAMPKPISYIVLDPNWSPSLPLVDGEDAQGRRYLLVSPAVLDEMQHRKWAGLDVLATPEMVASHLAAITVLRREDMPEGWPDAWPARQPKRNVG